MPFVFNDGVRIHYQVEGAGAPLVLQHGLSDSLWGWYEAGYVERLKDNFQLIMIDARGHGNSDKPHDPAAYDLKVMMSDVLAVINDLGCDRVYYCGYSLGCRIGFEFAHDVPERLQKMIMGGHHPYFSSTKSLKRIFKRGLDNWIEVLEDAVGQLTSASKKRLLNNDIKALRAVVANDFPDISNVLPTMTMGCRLFAGSQDPHYEKVKQAASQIPTGDFVSLRGQNHFQAYQRSDLVTLLIEQYILSNTS